METVNGLNCDDDTVTVEYCCKYLDRKEWFEQSKIMWKKHQSVFDDQIRYVMNYI